MDFNQLIGIVYVVLGFALVWLVIEIIVTVRRARKDVADIKRQVEPTLQHVQGITEALEPVTKKIDPLVDRVSLTVDAANLEIMRLDQILEDVGEVTDSVSSTVSTVDAITSAPMDLVNNVTSRVRGAFRARGASEESVALGDQKAEEMRKERERAESEGREAKRARAAERIRTMHGSKEQSELDQAQASAETPAAPAPSQEEGYFTYSAAKSEPAGRQPEPAVEPGVEPAADPASATEPDVVATSSEAGKQQA